MTRPSPLHCAVITNIDSLDKAYASLELPQRYMAGLHDEIASQAPDRGIATSDTLPGPKRVHRLADFATQAEIIRGELNKLFIAQSSTVLFGFSG